MVVIVSGMSALLLIHILLDVLFDVPTEKTEKVMQDVFNWVVASLFNIVGLLILIGIEFYLLGWLASIPAWAVVIIILLILLLLRL
jgi:L-asparagine transporter-like permease